MPYIKQEDRDKLADEILHCSPQFIGYMCISPGELNYLFTEMIVGYIDNNISYLKINEVIGVLECCKLEAYKRIAGPYENKKREENGDVY